LEGAASCLTFSGVDLLTLLTDFSSFFLFSLDALDPLLLIVRFDVYGTNSSFEINANSAFLFNCPKI
jgi:hypothetical protein